MCIKPGVENDFIQRGPGGIGSSGSEGYQGVDFGTQKLTNFDQNSKISLNLTKLRLNPFNLALIFQFWPKMEIYSYKILRGYFQNFSGQGVYPLPPIPDPCIKHR